MRHFFYKGKDELLATELQFEEKLKKIKKELSKVLETKNLSFLIGSGCSLGEYGIPTMKQLADVLFNSDEEKTEKYSAGLKKVMFIKEHIETLSKQGIKLTDEVFKNNIENFLGTLYSLRSYLSQVDKKEELEEVDKVIGATKSYILYQCLNEENKGKDEDILRVYKNFYRKLSLRDSNLPKPNIFTTNYDLYSEKSMDDLGITYTNGFSGFIQRYFNPAIFNYALAEQMDISSFKWNIIDNFIYLFKIHGSVNWVEVANTNKLFNVEELQSIDFATLNKDKKNIMIYPSPIKQNASLGSPYSDLFREFQKRIAQNQSVLITMGYSFSDEHINNLIYQALTIPTFRLVIFSGINYEEGGEPKSREQIEKLRQLNDPRIWIIGSEQTTVVNTTENESTEQSKFTESNDDEVKGLKEGTTKEEIEIIPEPVSVEPYLHYFETITNSLLPDWTENKIEKQNELIIENLIHSTKKPTR